jgi:hypothetical protein
MLLVAASQTQYQQPEKAAEQERVATLYNDGAAHFPKHKAANRWFYFPCLMCVRNAELPSCFGQLCNKRLVFFKRLS